MAFAGAEEDITREQLEVLKAKFDVLQGERRAYFDTYEQTKRTNDQLLRDLRERQKELAKQLTEAQKRTRAARPGAGGGGGASAGASSAGGEDAKVGDELIRKRAEYDKLRNKSQALKVDLEKINSDLLTLRNMTSGAAGSAAGAGAAGGSGAPAATGSSSAAGGGPAAARLADLMAAEGEDDDLRASSSSSAAAGASSSSSSSSSAAFSSLRDTPLLRRARAVEARLDKTALKYEEVLSIKRTYEGIVKRLRDERQGYDAQVGALERELSAKTRDYAELQVLAADAVRAFDSSHLELARVRASAAADRERQTHELREREGMARARRRHHEAQLARERARRDLLAEVAGDLGVSEERALVASVDAARSQRNALNEQAGVVKRKLEAYESAWRRIREATGVSEISEVTAKMAAQVEQHASLAALSRDNAQRLEALREEITAFSRLVQELRFTSGEEGEGGDGGGNSSDGERPPSQLGGDRSSSSSFRQQRGGGDSAGRARSGTPGGYSSGADEVSSLPDDAPRTSEADQLASATSRLEAMRDRQAQASARLVELRMGVSHLAGSLSNARAALGAAPLPAVGAGNTAHVLTESGATLRRILARLAAHLLATGADLLAPYGGIGYQEDEEELVQLAAEAGGGDEGAAAGAAPRALRAALSGGPPSPGQGEPPSNSLSSPLSQRRLDVSGGLSAAFNRIVPSPQALARLGLHDEDLMSARVHNNRVAPSALTGVAVSAPGSSSSSSSSPRAGGASTVGGDGPDAYASAAPPGNTNTRLAAFADSSRNLVDKSGAPAKQPGGGVAAAPDFGSLLTMTEGDVDVNAGGGVAGVGGSAEDALRGGGHDGALTREAIKRAARRTAEAHRPSGGGGGLKKKTAK